MLREVRIYVEPREAAALAAAAAAAGCSSVSQQDKKVWAAYNQHRRSQISSTDIMASLIHAN